MPARVITLLTYLRIGWGARSEPWVWMRPKDTRTRAHLYRRTFSGVPEEAGACGTTDDPFPSGTVTAWEPTGGKFGCTACKRTDEGEEAKGGIHPTVEVEHR